MTQTYLDIVDSDHQGSGVLSKENRVIDTHVGMDNLGIGRHTRQPPGESTAYQSLVD